MKATAKAALSLGCDFCRSLRPAWYYPCRSFSVVRGDGKEYSSEGAWLACRVCGDHIEHGDMEALVVQGLSLYADVEGFDRAASTVILTVLYSAFLELRGVRSAFSAKGES